jgi:alpha-tubulin suppressor-like RCC1 family protein
VAAGYYQGVGIASDGSLWTWGLKNLGWWTGTEQITELTPTRVGTASDWRAVGAGYRVAGAIRSDGSLWTFGDFVEEGQLGDGTTDIRLDPTQVGVGTTWSSVAFGFEHTVALDSSGGLWRWGKSEVEKADPVLVPQRVGTETGWASVGAGSSYTVALRP